jgi:hypothetical protein
MDVNVDFQHAISTLAALRTAVDKETASIEWASNSHADTEAPGCMQLAIADVAAVEVLAKSDLRLVAGTAAARRL